MSQESEERNRFTFGYVHGDKGGVGKSMFANALADFLIARGEPVAIIDADTQNNDVARMFRGSATCTKADLSNTSGWMDLIDFVDQNAGHHFVMNTPAGVGKHMMFCKDDFHNFAVFLRELDSPIDLDLWWVFGRSKDSVNLFEGCINAYEDDFQGIRMVRHMQWGDPSQFAHLNDSRTRERLLKKKHLVIDFPALHDRIEGKLFHCKETHPLPFSQALDVGIGEAFGFTVSERRVFGAWHNQMQNALAPAFKGVLAEPTGQ